MPEPPEPDGCPDSANGVPVHITATDENGETYTVGTVTSDLSGTFAAMWDPPKEGIYTITASFDGSGAYWPSYAATHVGVDTTPSGSIATLEPANQDNQVNTTIYIAIAAAVIVIVVVLAAIMLRRRK